MSQKISDMNVIPLLLAAHKFATDQPEVPGVSQYAGTIQQILDLALAGGWPLAGSADLTNDVTIDGNEHDLILGSPNSLDDFQVYVNNQMLFEADDEADSAIITLGPLGLYIEYIEGGESTLNGSWNILGQSTWDINLGTVPSPLSGLDVYVSSSIGMSVDDGVDSSSLTLTPTEFDLVVDDFDVTLQTGLISIPGATSGERFAIKFAAGNENHGLVYEGGGFGTIIPSFGVYNLVSGARSVVRPSNGIELYSADGGGSSVIFNIQDVESSAGARFIDNRTTKRGIEYNASGYVTQALSLTTKEYVDALAFPSAGFVLPSFTVAGQPSASPAGKIAYCSDESGDPTVVYSNGTNWLRIYDGQIIS